MAVTRRRCFYDRASQSSSQDRSTEGSNSTLRGPKIDPRRLQNQAKIAKTGARSDQERPKSFTRVPKSAPRTPKSAPRASKSAPRAPKSAPRSPKSAPRGSATAPRRRKTAPRPPNRGSQGAQERTEHPNRSNQGDLDETLPLRSEINENTAHAQQNRRPGVPRAARSSLPERPGTTRSAKSSQPGHPEQPDRASRGPIEPARTRQVVRLLAQLTARTQAGEDWSSNFVIDIYIYTYAGLLSGGPLN